MRFEKLKIVSIEIYQSPIQLFEPFVISLGLLSHAENCIVIIRTDKGISGTGECSPFRAIHGESMETCFIVGQYLAKGLLNKNPLNIEACTQTMDALMYGNASIKSAFDCALYDIAAQNAELPLYRFLNGKNAVRLVTDYTVSIGDPAKMALDALKIKQRGFQIIKIKLGGNREEDMERMHRIREAVGMEIPIRIDANQGWSTDTAIQLLNALAPLNIQHCEEPIPRWNFMELSKVRKESPIPIMADESCCDHHDAKRLIDLAACDLFNVKLGKSSGIYKAQKIIRLAEDAGIKIQVGGFLESRLGFTASAHLALTSKNILYCDFDTPMMFAEDPVVGGISYLDAGVVKVPDAVGLGATFDDAYLKQLTSITV